MTEPLMVINPDATYGLVDNDYHSIKRALNGGMLEAVYTTQGFAFYCDENALAERLQLNVVVSFMTQATIFGPGVMISATTGPEGETLPADDHSMAVGQAMADVWRRVLDYGATRSGQDIAVYANPDTVLPPQITMWTPEEFDKWLGGGR